MSKDNVKMMFGKMEKEAQLQEKYLELLRRNQNLTENVLTEKLIEFGRSSGFAFSKNDLMAARAEIMDKANSNRELSDNDLSNVAGGGGGKGNAAIVSIFSFGFACAMISIDLESSKAGECSKYMTTNGTAC